MANQELHTFGIFVQNEMRKEGVLRADFRSVEAPDVDAALALAIDGANDPKVSPVKPEKPHIRRYSVQGPEGRIAYRVDRMPGNSSATGVAGLRKAELVTLLQTANGETDQAKLDAMANTIIAARPAKATA